MGWSIPIATLRGTVIRLHITFLLFLVWIGVAYHAQGGWPAALEGVVFMSLLFLCVLLHELGHVFAARRYGIKTPDITLLPIGGVARMEHIPEKPAQEIVVALAGPAVNLVIAGILFVALGGFIPKESVEVQNAGVGVLERLASVNLFLALFNLIPAFPMDGGRVLRAALSVRMGHVRGTQTAATVGQAVAFGLGLLGLFGNPLLIFIALFVYLGASSEAHEVQMREVTRGVSVADAMITHFESLSPNAVLDDAVECMLRTTQHEFPVVDGAARLRGVLTRDALIRALRDHGPGASVLEVMRADIPVIGNRSKLDEALRLMQAQGLPAVGVSDGDGRLVGLVTPENVGEMMMVRAVRPTPAPPAPPGPIGSGPVGS